MSLFDEFQQWQLIAKPRRTWNYKHILKEQKEQAEAEVKDKKVQRKELANKKKAELSKEEFIKRRTKAYYEFFQEERLSKQLEYVDRQKEEKEKELENIYKEVYDPLPEPISYDKFYADKYREDDISYDGKFKYSWRASRIKTVKPSREERYVEPIKVYNYGGLDNMITNLTSIQDKAYLYIKPHIDEITSKMFHLSKRQTLTKNPAWSAKWKMLELAQWTTISRNQLCCVTDAILRGKYMVSEVYMWRVGFLVGDVIITEAGNVIRPCLENNIPWLNPDTVDELHKKRMDWLKRKDVDLKIYIVWDTYLFKYTPNEREKWFYLVPT